MDDDSFSVSGDNSVALRKQPLSGLRALPLVAAKASQLGTSWRADAESEGKEDELKPLE